MEGGLPKKDDFSTKVMNSSLLLHACVSVSKLIYMSHVLIHETIFITPTCLEMMNSALTLFHLKTCSFSTNLFQVLGIHDNSGS